MQKGASMQGSVPPTSMTSTVQDELERVKEQYCLSLKEDLVEKGHKFTGDLMLVIKVCGQCVTMKKECFFVQRISKQLEKCVWCVVQKKKCENVISESLFLNNRKSQLNCPFRPIPNE